jgi:hypothetical protein
LLSKFSPCYQTLYTNVLSYVKSAISVFDRPSPIFFSCTHGSDSLECLRSIDATTLIEADTAIGVASFMGTYTFVPVVDGTFIVERPSVTLNRGKKNGVSRPVVD